MKKLLLALACLFLSPPLLAQRVLKLNDQGELWFYEEQANGTNKIVLKSPASLAGDVTWTFPSADGTSGQFLQTNGSGTLQWASAAASLQAAYDGGKSITFTSTPMTWSSSNNANMLEATKTGTGAGRMIVLENDGTDEALLINQDGAGAALGIIQDGNASSVVITQNTSNACIALHATMNSAALQITQDDGEDAISTDGDVRCKQAISTTNCVLYNDAGLQFGESGHTDSGPFYDALTLSAANALFLGNAARDWPLNLRTGATQSMTFSTNSTTRLTINSAGTISSTQAGNSALMSLNKTGTGAGTALLVDNDGTGIGLSVVQDGAENAIRVAQNAAATAIAVTQATNARGMSIAKTGTGGNPALDIDNDGTGRGILLTQDGAGVAMDIDQNGDAIALRVDKATGSDPVIDIINAGTGPDVDGTSSTWAVTKAGNGKFAAMTYTPGSNLTIATGAITAVASFCRVDTEGAAASDDLDTISTSLPSGTILIIRAVDSARTVVLKDGTGNLALNGDFSLNNDEDTIQLIFQGTAWYELSRSDNGA